MYRVFIDDDPELVWRKVGILQQYKGKELFGLENDKVRDIIQSAPSCTLEEWNTDEVMDRMYAYHLKRRIPTSVDWKKLFNDWLSEDSTIIELQIQFKNLYPPNYNISDESYVHGNQC